MLIYSVSVSRSKSRTSLVMASSHVIEVKGCEWGKVMLRLYFGLNRDTGSAIRVRCQMSV